MRGYVLAGTLVSLLPAFALAAAMPDHRSGIPAALSAIPADASAANATTAPGATVTGSRFRAEPHPDHMMAGGIAPVTEQVKRPGGILVNLRSPTQVSESRFLIQPNEHSQPQAKTNDTRMAPATRVHIYWFFPRR
jgi:hypothetical protein